MHIKQIKSTLPLPALIVAILLLLMSLEKSISRKIIYLSDFIFDSYVMTSFECLNKYEHAAVSFVHNVVALIR